MKKKKSAASSATVNGREHSEGFMRSAQRHGARTDTADAFVPDPDNGAAVIADDLAQGLGEEFVTAATSGESSDEEFRDQMLPEETGGPFVETSAAREFAKGTDASNPTDAEPAAFPTANRASRR